MRIDNGPKLELIYKNNEILPFISAVEVSKYSCNQLHYQAGISNANHQISSYPSYLGLQLLSSAEMRSSQDLIIYDITRFPYSQEYFPTNIRNKQAFYYPNQSNAYY